MTNAHRKWPSFPSSPRTRLILAALVVFLLGALVWGVPRVRAYFAMRTAETALRQEFGAYASDSLDRHRRLLVRTERGCRLLLEATYLARQPDKLEWAAESCLFNGIEIPESHIGRAAGKELRGDDRAALGILQAAIPKFKDNPDLHYRIAIILKRNKNVDGSVRAYQEAVRRSTGNDQLTFEALQYFGSLNRWADAGQMAALLKNTKSENPEVKLVIARALIKANDNAGAAPLIRDAQEILARGPSAAKEQIEKAFEDILGSTPGSTPGGTPAMPPPPGASPKAALPPPGKKAP